ncbi:MAG: flavodoxin family protein [Anaerosomatales bacterium]|nr:flavodoxin family protein [Anaerosomatales bacterium]
MKVVAFNCSPRREGNTARLLEAVLAELRAEGIDTETLSLAGKRVHGCTACMKCRETLDRRCSGINDYISECIEAIDAADGIVIGSPVYFADVTPEAKALIDRVGYVARGNPELLRRKVGAAVIAVRRGGAIHAFDSINHLFLISEMVVPGSSYWNIGIGGPPGAVEQDDEGLQTMKRLGQNMAWLLKRVRSEG